MRGTFVSIVFHNRRAPPQICSQKRAKTHLASDCRRRAGTDAVEHAIRNNSCQKTYVHRCRRQAFPHKMRSPPTCPHGGCGTPWLPTCSTSSVHARRTIVEKRGGYNKPMHMFADGVRAPTVWNILVTIVFHYVSSPAPPERGCGTLRSTDCSTTPCIATGVPIYVYVYIYICISYIYIHIYTFIYILFFS